MPDPNTIPVVPQATDDPARALVGKIARLPAEIREEVNHRLHDGQSASEILPWLNDLPAVKEILARQFDGQPIKSQNLSPWRKIGYRRWLDKKLASTRNLGEHAAKLLQAAGGQLAPAAAAVASGKLLKYLDIARDVTPDDIVKCSVAAAHLAKAEQDNARVKIANERLRQAELHLLLKRDKMQRDDVATRLHILNDARAKEIASSSESEAAKIEILGIHTYGDDWEQRPLPDPDNNNAAPDAAQKPSDKPSNETLPPDTHGTDTGCATENHT